ncbi:HlyD family secretion protein [Blastomonas sp. AAP53]|uniref:HlyD family secretion protein n=1 Tax=Blastomonas sp. AAP53 TaxID=1248760 RepID=UPI0003089370|nr:HlyD family secretion protein [Blastomonas sp. AAP53]
MLEADNGQSTDTSGTSSIAGEDSHHRPAPPVIEPGKKRRWPARALMLSVPLALAAVGGYLWLSGGRYVTTDNAYVQQDKVAVSPEVGGRIIDARVRENMTVAQGDILFRIDPEPYQLAVRQANADIAGAQVSVATLASEARSTGVGIAAARDAIAYAQIDLERQQALMQRGFTTRARLDEAERKVEIAREQLRAAQAEAAEASARLTTGSAMPGVNPAVAQAMVRRDAAALNLDRTIVRAPVSGRVVQAERLQPGQSMVVGLPALTIVADNRSWIEANFKETDLHHMRVGQAAEVRLDAYPDLKLTGRVDSIGAGTGSEFSILPAQNATGNWVKVTQRVPVRIRLDSRGTPKLIAGLSAEVTVDTGKRR